MTLLYLRNELFRSNEYFESVGNFEVIYNKEIKEICECFHPKNMTFQLTVVYSSLLRLKKKTIWAFHGIMFT
ncbi:hypothetical protein T4B_7217 [Trichinella pseudospiralis]|uniref:Uncharacterized protein n=1 Tax=Trichinella pseudospiralis TaxID=6337 RepID=A0A0V1J7B6_TRIPS|nr:hypothetical protein T4B_7217 [Trichinella pseudospiralis]KRZ30887.1 hypothetical protein T4C_1031 [Trichinella pseudospiralis]